MRNLIFFLLFALFVSCGNKTNLTDDDAKVMFQAHQNGYKTGYKHGEYDGSNNYFLYSSYDISNDYETEIGILNYEGGYKSGYDAGYKKGKETYDADLAQSIKNARQVLERVTVTTRSTPNTYSSPEYSSTPIISSSTLHSNDDIYSNYPNYEETDDCVGGEVVYEGNDDFYIIETRRGFTILEVYSGILYEGNKVRGELNRYGFKYLINRNRDSEVRVYIEDYMLSDDEALEWLGDHDHLDDDDQRIYDENND